MTNRDYVKAFLSHSGFLVINRSLIKAIGLNETVLLSLMIDRDAYFVENNMDVDGWFYSVKEYIQDNLNLGRKPIDSAMINLVDSNLIETKLLGIPAKKYYRVNYDGIKDLMDQIEPACLSETDDPDCPKRTNKDDQYGPVSNNKDYKEQITKNKNKEQIGKEKVKKEIDLSFVGAEYRDMFARWLWYKHDKKQAYKTQMTIETCYRHLLELSNNDPRTAQAIIEQSIANNYSGLFALKQNNYGGSTTAQQPRNRFCELAETIRANGGVF